VQRHPGIASKILLGLTRIISERLQATGQEIRRLQAAAAASAVPTGTDSEEDSHESLKQ
jgi:hypothetical protein